MAHLRHMVAVCTMVAIAVAATPIIEPPLTWSISPNPPSAGDTLTISVTGAPSTPVQVKVYVDGTLIHNDWINAVPGSTDCQIPSGSQGDDFEVYVISGASQDSKEGTVGG